MGVFGCLYGPLLQLFTVERPWKGNQPYISCIPKGRYALEESRLNQTDEWALELEDVPNRTLIKIHVGNLASDVQGCIAVGRRLGSFDGKWAVLYSRAAMLDLKKHWNAWGGNSDYARAISIEGIGEP